jgi:hypothetical protein
MRLQRETVRFGRISFMTIEPVFRIFRVHFTHNTVARYLSDYGSRADTGYLGIAFHDGKNRDAYFRTVISVAQHLIGLHWKIVYRSLHREHRCLQYIYFVDLETTRLPDSDRDG